MGINKGQFFFRYHFLHLLIEDLIIVYHNKDDILSKENKN